MKNKILLLLFVPLSLFNCSDQTTNTESNTTEEPSVSTSYQETESSEEIRYLALGDSYTIGENVAEADRWPNLLVKKLEDRGITVSDQKIIAQTGWTTRELLDAIAAENLESYNLVSLLIGVNDEYDTGDTVAYRKDFTEALEKSIELAGGAKNGVFVLSIPDYSVTPFIAQSEEKEANQVRAAIAYYNAINQEICASYEVDYYNITPISQEADKDTDLLAEDGLHPSAKMYNLWVAQIYEQVAQKITNKLAQK